MLHYKLWPLARPKAAEERGALMRGFRYAWLLLVGIPLVPSFAFASDQPVFPVQFTVKAASYDSGGCYMSFVNNGVEYSVRSGSILHACPIFRPGTTLNGRLRDGQRYIQISYTGKDGKEKTEKYEVREVTLLPH
jgi:hypothetical protein